MCAAAISITPDIKKSLFNASGRTAVRHIVDDMVRWYEVDISKCWMSSLSAALRLSIKSTLLEIVEIGVSVRLSASSLTLPIHIGGGGENCPVIYSLSSDDQKSEQALFMGTSFSRSLFPGLATGARLQSSPRFLQFEHEGRVSSHYHVLAPIYCVLTISLGSITEREHAP